jgi:hypothetical protein
MIQFISSLQIGRPNWMEGQRGSNDNPELEKKANAFFGSRGKRSTYSNVGHINHYKDDGIRHRDTHNENFFATRG